MGRDENEYEVEEGPSDWEWAQDTGLTDGTDPQGNLTREQAAIFAHLEAAKSLLSLKRFVICLAAHCSFM